MRRGSFAKESTFTVDLPSVDKEKRRKLLAYKAFGTLRM
jgi:hypothetical protein